MQLYTNEQQYSWSRKGKALYEMDLGLAWDPFYKVEGIGWYVMGRASLVSRNRLRFCMWSGFGDGSG